MTNKAKKIYWLAGLGVAALGIAALFFFTQRQVTKNTSVAGVSPTASQGTPKDAPAMVSLTSEAMVSAGISVVPVEIKSFNSQVSAVGIFEIPDPAERTVAAYARGRIERMYVASTGDYVRKGEPLFEFYSPDILAAEKDYLIAAGIGEIDKDMMSKNPGMEHHSNPGLLRAAQERLKLYGLTNKQVAQLAQDHTVPGTVTVTSPLNGVVLQKLSQEGAYVDEGTSIFQLADLSSVWAEVDVPEAYIRFIRMGQVIRIQTSAYSNEQFAGKVILGSPVEDQASHTIRVRLALPSHNGELRPGMTFTATIPIAAGRALAVPQAAVIQTGNGNYVWMADSNYMFTRHSVALGMLSPENYYEVESGLSAGDRVAANGAFLIDAEHELTKGNPMAGMNMGETGSKNSGEGTATVRAINVQQETITLDHSAIPGMMPPMTMGYKVSDPKFLQSVTINESVRFTLSRMGNGDFEITAIEKQ